MVAYDRVLSGLSEVTSHHASRDVDSDSEVSDGDTREMTRVKAAAAAAGTKAAKAAQKAAKKPTKLQALPCHSTLLR